MGTGVAAHDGLAHWPAAVVAAVGAILIQVGTNLANDYFDFIHGADTADRLGPTRATSAGLVTPGAMKRAFLITFALAVASGIYLIARGGWPVLAIGLISIATGVLYTGGPRPLGYLGLGDLLVLIFFGPVAVGGTYYVQALRWSEASLVAGLAAGALSTALLVVNNLRDLETDARSGKRTLAVRWGPRFSKAEFVGCVATAALIPVLLWARLDAPPGILLATVVTLVGVPAIRTVLGATPGDRLEGALAGAGRLLAIYGIAFLVGYLL
jgi:1,4-dihydroxy-2-naphthoate octaprenyltransferase